MKVYEGTNLIPGDRSGPVTVDGQPLDPRMDLEPGIAPDTEAVFHWGYKGSGPERLALAILADALGSDADALALRRRLLEQVIASLPPVGKWNLAEAYIRQAVA